jgi:hypothetical protein
MTVGDLRVALAKLNSNTLVVVSDESDRLTVVDVVKPLLDRVYDRTTKQNSSEKELILIG